MELEIRNWDKYNPKRDQKTYSWLRLNNDLFSGQDFSEFSPVDVLVWICLLCEASKKNSPIIEIKAGYIQRVTKLTLVEICDSICTLHNDKFLEVQGAVAPLHRAVALLHFTTPVTTPTYVRTDERTNDIPDFQSAGEIDYTHPLDIPCDPIKAPAKDFDIEALYSAYPKKEGRKKGLANFKRRIKTQKDYKQVKTAIENYTNACKGKERQFIKHFETFSNCWEDYLEKQEKELIDFTEDEAFDYFEKRLADV